MSLCRRDIQETRRIANGGMARLALGIDREGNQLVVRELHRRLVFNLRMHRSFRRGTKIRFELCPHPNLVCPLVRGYCGLVPYEIIEYVPGSNLRELIVNEPARIRNCALNVLRQVAAALTYMHTRQILHLDVKPENILVEMREDEAPVVKLTDFDLSRRFRGRAGRLHSGTASHMAPEQLKAGEVSYANDIFAFGVMAYYLVTGKMPFSGFSLDEVRRQQVSRSFEVVEPKRHNSELAPKLNWIILKCLEKDPDRRFPNMAYLLQELGRI